MANITFTALAPEALGADAGFRVGRQPSIFVNGVRFRIRKYELGRWQGTEQDEKSVSIMLYGNESSESGDANIFAEGISVNRFLRKEVVFNADGKMLYLARATFGEELRRHLDTLGRRADDERFLNATPDKVAQHILAFFKDKEIVCTEIPDLFRKDKEGRLYGVTFVQFSFA
jgi:hypothetical protein